MAFWIPLLIIALIWGALRNSEHKRKVDFGFLVVILVAAVMIWNSQY